MKNTMNLYDFKVLDINKQEVSLADYKGKVVLIVNTATRCGFTPQFEGLEKLYADYKDKGLVVLGFPCNQFANQAPENDAEIASFCSLRYDVKFPQLAKIIVNGEGESPLYTWLKSEQKGTFGNAIKWNFTKFLIDREGNAVGRFAPTVTPAKLEKEIQIYL